MKRLCLFMQKLCLITLLSLSMVSCDETETPSDETLIPFQGTWTSGCIQDTILDFALNGDTLRLQLREYQEGSFCSEADFIQSYFFSGTAVAPQQLTLETGMSVIQGIFISQSQLDTISTLPPNSLWIEKEGFIEILLQKEQKQLVIHKNTTGYGTLQLHRG